MSRRARRLNLPQRLVLVAALAGGLAVLGSWVTGGASSFTGWTGYAPLIPAPRGLHSWARLLIWLGFIAVWMAASLWLLRGAQSNGAGAVPATGGSEAPATAGEHGIES